MPPFGGWSEEDGQVQKGGAREAGGMFALRVWCQISTVRQGRGLVNAAE